VMRELIQAWAAFASGCDQGQLEIASESTTVASELSAARAIQAGLGLEGTQVELTSVAADFGIERGSGAVVAKPRRSKRLGQATRK
ncbi:unnamed protein product, partial [Prorocentrum cordatum]